MSLFKESQYKVYSYLIDDECNCSSEVLLENLNHLQVVLDIPCEFS